MSLEAQPKTIERDCTSALQRVIIEPVKWGFQGEPFSVIAHEVLVKGPQGKTVNYYGLTSVA